MRDILVSGLCCWQDISVLRDLGSYSSSILPYDPAIALLGIYPEKTIIQKESCTTTFITALFTIARRWKPPKCPLTDDWINSLRLRSRWLRSRKQSSTSSTETLKIHLLVERFTQNSY